MQWVGSLALLFSMLIGLPPRPALGQDFVFRRRADQVSTNCWVRGGANSFALNFDCKAVRTSGDFYGAPVQVAWDFPATITTSNFDVPVTINMPTDFWSDNEVWGGPTASIQWGDESTIPGQGAGYSFVSVYENGRYHAHATDSSQGLYHVTAFNAVNGACIPPYLVFRAYMGSDWFGYQVLANVEYDLDPGTDTPADATLAATNISPAPGQPLERGSRQSFQADLTYSQGFAEHTFFGLTLWDDTGKRLESNLHDICRTYGVSTRTFTLGGPSILVPTNTTRLVLKAMFVDPSDWVTWNILNEITLAEYPVVDPPPPPPPVDLLMLANVSPPAGQILVAGSELMFKADVTYAVNTRTNTEMQQLELRLFTAQGLLYNTVRNVSPYDHTNTVALSIPATGTVWVPFNATNIFLQAVLREPVNLTVIKQSQIIEYPVVPAPPKSHAILGTIRQGDPAGPPIPGVSVRLNGGASQTNVTDATGQFMFTGLHAGNFTVTPLTNGFPGIQFDPPSFTFDFAPATSGTNNVTFVATNRIVVLRALEVVQVVQDWENSVPLIADKRTSVRVYLQLFGTNTQAVRMADVTLRLSNATGSTNLTPFNAPAGHLVFTNNVEPVRWLSEARLLFWLPPAWRTGENLRLSLEWTNGVLVCAEPAEPGGAAHDGVVVVSFQPMPSFQVQWLMIQWTGTNGIVHQPSPGSVNELTERLLALYPVSRVEASPPAPFAWLNNPPQSTNTPNNKVGLVLKYNLVEALRSLHDSNVQTNPSPRLYYGIIPDINLGGLASGIPGDVAAGAFRDDPESAHRNLHAHELGHDLGLHHAVVRPEMDSEGRFKMVGNCGEEASLVAPVFPFIDAKTGYSLLGPLDQGDDRKVFGLDSHGMSFLTPYDRFELMGYCVRYHEWHWPSTFTYTNLISAIRSRFEGTFPGPHGPKFAPADYLLVRGVIALDTDVVDFDPFYPLSTAFPPLVAPGEYTLIMLDSAGAVLSSIPFRPDVLQADFPAWEEGPLGCFSIPVPVSPGMARAVVVHTNQPVALTQASLHGPSVQVLAPVGGEVFGPGAIPVRWEAQDLDGDSLWFQVQYSSDGGATWETFATDWPTPAYDLDTAALRATTQGLIRVIASDGFLSSRDQSPGVFTVLNHPPDVTIKSPQTNDVFIANQQLIFQAHANDTEDGALDSSSVEWHSSLDGRLGTGAELFTVASALSAGDHTISVIARDSAGATNRAAVTIRVQRQEMPRLSIRTSNLQTTLCWHPWLTNYVLESSAAPTASSWNTVTNVPVVTDVEQSVTFEAAPTTKFFRLRKQPSP
jgi:hypothetical protein